MNDSLSTYAAVAIGGAAAAPYGLALRTLHGVRICEGAPEMRRLQTARSLIDRM